MKIVTCKCKNNGILICEWLIYFPPYPHLRPIYITLLIAPVSL